MATYDIHFQLVPDNEQLYAGGRVFTFGFTSALGVKGPQKLVNRWIKCLFTPKGSDLLDSQYGTAFPDLIGSNVSAYQDFADGAALCINDCSNQITAFDQLQFPPDNERLDSANLTSIVARDGDGFDVYVTIKNVAGSLLTVQLPTGSTRT
jgi:hypothetical protein